MGRIRLTSFIEMNGNRYRSWEGILLEVNDLTAFVRVVRFKDFLYRLINAFSMCRENLRWEGESTHIEELLHNEEDAS